MFPSFTHSDRYGICTSFSYCCLSALGGILNPTFPAASTFTPSTVPNIFVPMPRTAASYGL
jgi:hypothetical protein